jgi:hypothetical protein
MTETIKTRIISMLIFMCLMFNLFPIETMLNLSVGLGITFKTAGMAGLYAYNPFSFCESMSNKITGTKKETAKQEKQNRQEPADDTTFFAIINNNGAYQRSGLSFTNVSAGNLPFLSLTNDIKSVWIPDFAKMTGLALFAFFLLTYLAILFRKDRLTTAAGTFFIYLFKSAV